MSGFDSDFVKKMGEIGETFQARNNMFMDALSGLHAAEPTPHIPAEVFTPPPNPLIALANAESAEATHEQIMELISEFEQDLDADHEVAVRLVSFGQAVTFHVQSIGHYNPKLIIFHGTLPDGDQMQLIQHVSQLSFLLMSAKKRKPQAVRIGFRTETTAEEGGA